MRVTSANLDFALGNDREYIAWLCQDADVLLVQEAKDRVLANLLSEGWTSLQDTSDGAHMGTAIAVRDATVEVTDHGLALGAKPLIGGKHVGMLTRYIAWAELTERATGESGRFISPHFPPGRFRVLQPGYEKNLRALMYGRRDIVIGTDANQPIDQLAKRLGFEWVGRGIVGVLSGRDLTGRKIRTWGIHHHATDHPSVSALVHLHRKERRMSKIEPPAPPYVGPPAHFSPGNNKPIGRIVIHSTVSACKAGGARQIASYFRSIKAGGSAHYVVDPASEVQVAYDSVICWHAPPNANSLGIEMCDTPGPIPGDKPGSAKFKAARRAWRWINPDQMAMLDRTAALTAQLALAYGIPLVFLSAEDLRAGKHGITTHANVSAAWGESTHWDPGFWPRRRFLKLVRKHADALLAAH
ncbi:MAG: N-acetylmuramoyl-L-alanine amidase [Mycobacteriaceae bacterium]